MTPFLLEIIADSVQSAQIAQESGAHRLEIVASLESGGISPSYGTVQKIREISQLPLMVMIRPRAGDFVYTEGELQVMAADIEAFKGLGVDGFVLGCLSADGTVDTAQMAALKKLADPLPITFHRAFDLCKNPFAALDSLISLGIPRLLSSGGKQKAIDGRTLLSQLVKYAQDQIIIMPGSGIKPDNIVDLARVTGAKEFHMSARCYDESPAEYWNPSVDFSSGALDQKLRPTVDAEAIRKSLSLLAQVF